jgi:hypothetical protein
MAKFSQTFLQGLLQPTYQQGLFTAAQQAAQLPGQLRQQQAQQEEMQRLRGMGAVERADFMAARAQTPQQLMAAEAAKGGAVKASALESLRGLEAARQAASTPEEKEKIESIMSRVAVQAGVDPSTITGRTQEEADDQVRRELNENRLKEEKRASQEEAIAQAYYAVPENVRVEFEENAIKSGFGDVIDELKKDKAKAVKFDLDMQNAKAEAANRKAMAKMPLATGSLRERIQDSNIDQELKDIYISQLDEIENKQPDFANDETWNPGGRQAVERELTNLNSEVGSAVREHVRNKNAIKREIRNLEETLTKPPTKAQIDAKLPDARENLATVSTVLGYEIVSAEQDEEVVRQRATELARIERDNAIKNQIKTYRSRIGEQPVEEQKDVDEFVVGQVYQDASGNRARYLGNGEFEELN